MRGVNKLIRNKKVIVCGILALTIIGVCVAVAIKNNSKAHEKITITDSKIMTGIDKGSEVKIDSLSKNQEDGLFKLCKVWGFLKYYHPEVAKGKFDWDQELFKMMAKVIAVNENKEIDNLIFQWAAGLGEFEQEAYSIDEKVKIHPNTKWIKDNTFMIKQLTDLLSNIEMAKRTGENYYVDVATSIPEFTNEKVYPKFDYKDDDGIKLLGLFRYWNIIEYYYPYRNILEFNWDEVLREFIPKMIECKDEMSYKVTLCELAAKIQDGHSLVYDKNLVIDKFFGTNIGQVTLKLVENKIVITEKLDGLDKASKINIGDVILKINNKDVNELIKDKLKYFSRTNKETYNSQLIMSLIRTNDKTINLELLRDGNIIKENINCIGFRETESKKKDKPSYENIKEDIAYLFPGTLKQDEVTEIIDKIKDKKDLIVDLRCYPSIPIIYRLGNYLMREPAEYIKFTAVNGKVPGQFLDIQNEITKVENQNYYKGKVVIIIDERTRSQAESTAMLFRHAPNSIIIGSKSSGANGDISQVVLPGQTVAIISALGASYPDGTQIQRIGIVPDIEVKPTLEGIKTEKDELLQKAIEIINKQYQIRVDVK